MEGDKETDWATAMLELKDIHTYYGESHVLQGMSLHVNRGECVALLGPNGMGKSTTLRTIMGLTPARRGSVTFQGRDITHLPPFSIARLGIGYVPDDRGIFGPLSVLQNLKVPFLNRPHRDSERWKALVGLVFALFPVLNERQGQMAGSLSGGEQQMLATARAMISGQEMVLLDEPTEGLAPLVVRDLIAAFMRIKAQGHTLLLVEQDLHTPMQVADRCYVLQKGRVQIEESMAVVSQRPDLLDRYLGGTSAKEGG